MKYKLLMARNGAQASPPHEVQRQQATEATDTAKKYLVQAAKQHTEAKRCNTHHRPA